MRPFTPLRPAGDARLSRANPVAKLVAAGVLMVALFVSVDAVTPALALVGMVAALPLTGLSPRALFARLWPILLAALAITVLNTAFAARVPDAATIALGPLTVERAAAVAAIGLGLRVIAVALAGVLALVTTDPTDLADALQQQLRVPPRWAVGVLAAMRLVPVLAVDRQTVAMARRARGVEAGWNPVTAVRLAASVLFGLLVTAIRRGTRLAVAMEARGFGTRPCRTSARRQQMRRGDWLLVAGAALLATGAIGVSVAAGSWTPLIGR
jgi:energy-coupling factor transport system permease protein